MLKFSLFFCGWATRAECLTYLKSLQAAANLCMKIKFCPQTEAKKNPTFYELSASILITCCNNTKISECNFFPKHLSQQYFLSHYSAFTTIFLVPVI